MAHEIARKKGPANIPSVVQLTGGVKLTALPFRVVERNEDGSPKLFELCPPGTQIQGIVDMWALFADEASIRKGY